MSPPTTKTTTTFIKQYRCDVCKVKCFPTMAEACRHEEECMKRHEQGDSPAEAQKQVHAFFQPAKKRKTATNAAVTSTSASKPSSTTTNTRTSKPEKPTSFPRTDRPRRKIKKLVEVDDQFDDEEDSRKSRRPIRRAKAAKAESKTKKNNKNGGPDPSLASILKGKGTKKKIMAEQVAAEFQAKRRLAQQQQREREQRRREQQNQKGPVLPAFGARDKNKVTRTTKKSIPKRQERKCLDSPGRSRKTMGAAARARLFPVPSHIWPLGPVRNTLSLSANTWLNQEVLTESRTTLKTSTFPGAERNEVNVCDWLFLLQDAVSSFVPESVLLDPVFVSLSSVVVPPAKIATTSSLWADTYSIGDVPGDLCGKSLRAVAKEMLGFVEKWMVERERANQRMAERQRALINSRVKKKKKASTSRYDVDDEWFSSDDEDSQLDNIFLVTGPVGSGKSSLVHAVAAQCGCKVLEMNTSDNRGAAAVRHAIEEATQSLSSLQMLKKSSLFAKHELENSDEEESGGTKGSSLTVILIDEVDNLCEEDGVAGFWATLCDLRKRAKCPIFLTANLFPDGLSSLPHTHEHIHRPIPSECGPRIKQILQSEGFTMRDCHAKDIDRCLENVADLCGCDLRRISHVLQAFAYSVIDSEQLKSRMPTSPFTSQPIANQDICPCITEINPSSVSPTRCTLVTIKGANFLRLASSSGGNDCYPVEVTIGDQTCTEARIMDDSTILAVCPPCHRLPHVDASGRYLGTHQQSLISGYVPVAVHSLIQAGIVSSSLESCMQAELPGGMTLAQNCKSCLIEYCFQPVRSQLDNGGCSDDSDAENEFVGDTLPIVTTSTCLGLIQTEAPSLSDKHRELAKDLLKDGVTKWTSEHPQNVAPGPKINSDRTDIDVVTSLEQITRLASDGVVVDDAGLVGLPYLSGPCYGFGFDLTEDFPKCTNDKNKPPSEERLFTLGWKDDCYFYGGSDAYVTLPSSFRERNLLKRGEADARGHSFPYSFALETEDEADVLPELWANEEDSFLVHRAPVALNSLPTILRNASSLKCSAFKRLEDDHLFERTRRTKMQDNLELLSAYIFPQTPLSQMERRCHIENADRLLTSRDLADPQLLLDYLPMLRRVAILDRAAEHVFNAALNKDPELAMSISNHRRSTRRARQQGFQHYFAEVVPDYVRRQTDIATVRNLGAGLAQSYIGATT